MRKKPLFFTEHILKRMAQRGFSKSMVYAILKNGEWMYGDDKYNHIIEYKGLIVVLFEQKTQYNVGTCKLNRENTIKAEQLKEEKGISYWQACHKIIKQIDLTEEIASLELD